MQPSRVFETPLQTQCYSSGAMLSLLMPYFLQIRSSNDWLVFVGQAP